MGRASSISLISSTHWMSCVEFALWLIEDQVFFLVLADDRVVSVARMISFVHFIFDNIDIEYSDAQEFTSEFQAVCEDEGKATI